jgi:hypothetical protein
MKKYNIKPAVAIEAEKGSSSKPIRATAEGNSSASEQPSSMKIKDIIPR